MKVLDVLLQQIRSMSQHYNPEVESAPACILWPDRERQWEPILPHVLKEMPELLVLGKYEPKARTGPAIWLRCTLARKIATIALPQDRLPVLYLPGVGFQDLKAVERCPQPLEPLIALQFRGTVWSQRDGSDWTVLAFLQSLEGGLGLDVAPDRDTQQAMHRALPKLIFEEISFLQNRRLTKDFFDSIAAGRDLIRDILQWLDQEEVFRQNRDHNAWKVFVERCKSELSFDPQKEGVLKGIENFANHTTSGWHAVWERFCEAPLLYPTIPKKIRSLPPPTSIFWHSSELGYEGWPQWNDEQEQILSTELQHLSQLPYDEAKKKLLILERDHEKRRALVWAKLGEAPFACALEHLARIAQITDGNSASGTVQELAKNYQEHGWRADEAALKALSFARKANESEVISAVLRAVYLPWLEHTSRYLQDLVERSSYPGGDFMHAKSYDYMQGECVLFVDGLRFDLAKRLAASLGQSGYAVTEEITWAALPSVTATGKPAVSPVKNTFQGYECNPEFEPSLAETSTGQSGGYYLNKMLTYQGWEVLDNRDKGNSQGNAWVECGNIDMFGHTHGAKLVQYVDGELEAIRDRITELFAAGWKCVHVVTDHGWLLMPGGLPSIELPTQLAETKWSRCALLKPGAQTQDMLFPWFWNPNCYIALADGVRCYRRGEEYAHGGLSLQECLTLHLKVEAQAAQLAFSPCITQIRWKGLRCTVSTESARAGILCDLRTEPGNPSSSLVEHPRPLKEDGSVSLVVIDEDFEGKDAMIVLLDENNTLLAQRSTVIGGGSV